jgi:hypothetical protein
MTSQAQSAPGDIDHLKFTGGKGITHQVSLNPVSMANFRVADIPQNRLSDVQTKARRKTYSYSFRISKPLVFDNLTPSLRIQFP